MSSMLLLHTQSTPNANIAHNGKDGDTTTTTTITTAKKCTLESCLSVRFAVVVVGLVCALEWFVLALFSRNPLQSYEKTSKLDLKTGKYTDLSKKKTTGKVMRFWKIDKTIFLVCSARKMCFFTNTFLLEKFSFRALGLINYEK